MHRYRNAWVLLVAALLWLGPALGAAPESGPRHDTTVEDGGAVLGSTGLAAWISALWQAVTGTGETAESAAQEGGEDDAKDGEPGPGGPTQELGPWIVPIG